MLDFRDTGGLFEHFEVNPEPFWPRISRLLGGSIVFHAALVACVVFIPSVRNALSVAALFSDAGFVDRDYVRTQIGDDVAFVEFGNEKFHYPAGYFLMDQQGLITELPPSAAYVPPPMPKFVPQPSPSPSPSPEASPSAVVASETGSQQTDPKGGDKKSATATPSPNPADVEKAQKDLEKTAQANGIELPKEGEINKKPFKDFVVYANDLKNEKKLDMNQEFEVVIETQLDQDGKLKNPQFIKKSGDVNLTDLGGRLVSALNDSGVLFYLKKLAEDNPDPKVTFTIKQDTQQVIATVESETRSAGSARGLASAFSLMLSTGADSRAGKNEEIYLRNTKVTSADKKLVFSLTLPRQTVIDLLKAEIAAAPSSGSPSPP